MKKLYSFILGVVFIAAFSQTVVVPSGISTSENYVYSRQYLESTTTSNVAAKQIQSVTYYDGLGRPKQSIAIKASSTGKDLVTPVVYDGFGRQVLDYLPIPQSGSTNGQIYNQTPQTTSNPVAFPVADATGFYAGEKIYSEKILENSPLDRVLEQYGPGKDWETYSKRNVFEYLASKTTDAVKKYSFNTGWGGDGATTYSIPSYTIYGDNELYKNLVKDEDNNETIEFKNGRGQTVLVRKVLSPSEHADTYYLYNDYDQLTLVISPLAALKTYLDYVDLDELCYQYRYDGRNRLVEKKLPGKWWEYMVYDRADRLILTRDSKMAQEQKWLITKYDKFGRVAYTGITPGSDRSAMQDVIKDLIITEERQDNGGFTKNGMNVFYTKHYYNDMESILLINYYDTYPSDMPAVSTMGFTQTFLSDNSQNSNVSTKSLPTASYIKNIEDNDWTKNYSFYDLKGRATASYTKNHLGGYTKTESILDFPGVPQKIFTNHKRLNNGTEVKIEETFTYDHQNRLVKHEHQVNNQAPEILAENTYNEIGQLQTKKVGNNIQEINYKYNIRGWLTAVNNPDNIATMGTDLFGYRIRYNEPIQGLQNPNADFPQLTVKPRYNGNIAEVDWNSVHHTGSPPRFAPYRFGYVYDGLNRLLAGFYQNQNNAFPGVYHEIIDEYDFNGNIKKLKRFGGVSKLGQVRQIDDLSYTYNGNKVTHIDDAKDNTSGYEGGNGLIEYNLNGNMTKMPDKGITAIEYNFLNLPVSIRQQNITNYLYRSDGVKLKKSYTINNDLGTNTLNTEYLDGFHYVTMSGDIAQQLREPDDNTVNARTATEEEVFILPEEELIPINPGTVMALSFFPTAEGFYDYRKKQYIYQYKDHLGNVRLSYGRNTTTNKIEILDRNDYYPFGMNFLAAGGGSIYNPQGSPFNYKYNGKELQETGFTDFGARQYMADIGRWFVVDLLADIAPSLTPYRYGFNNPISFTDPFGLFETRKEAREYRREHDISGSISKNKDGSFSINDKTNHVSYTKGTEGSGENFANDGVQESALVIGQKKDSNTENNNSQYNLASSNNNYNPLNIEKNWPHLVGPSMLLAGQDIVPKSFLKNIGMRGFVPRGVNANTSVASVVLRNAIPKTWPRLKFLPKATSLGGQLGRAVPLVGAGVTIWDYAYNFAPWVSDQVIEALPYSQEQKQDKHPGKWMEDAGVCFQKGTIVIGDKGNVNIEDIKVGDKVYSYNEETKESELSTVDRIYKRTTGEIFELAIGKEVILVTREHPFYVINKGWTKVGDLKIGDEIKTQYQNVTKLESYKIHTGEVTVYNIEVSKNHNYYVSDSRILVHNKNIKPEK